MIGLLVEASLILGLQLEFVLNCTKCGGLPIVVGIVLPLKPQPSGDGLGVGSCFKVVIWSRPRMHDLLLLRFGCTGDAEISGAVASATR